MCPFSYFQILTQVITNGKGKICLTKVYFKPAIEQEFSTYFIDHISISNIVTLPVPVK